MFLLAMVNTMKYRVGEINCRITIVVSMKWNLRLFPVILTSDIYQIVPMRVEL